MREQSAMVGGVLEKEVEILLNMLASALLRNDVDAMLFAASMVRARVCLIEGSDDLWRRKLEERANALLAKCPTRLVGMASVRRFVRRFGMNN